jgi:hypothetical protein
VESEGKGLWPLGEGNMPDFTEESNNQNASRGKPIFKREKYWLLKYE